MALPTSGAISISDIYTEQNGSAPSAGSNVSLRTLAIYAALIGYQTETIAISDFYGYDGFKAQWSGAMFNQTLIQTSSNGTKDVTIQTFYQRDGYPYELSNSYSVLTSNTNFSYTLWQDYDGVIPDSFLVNANTRNRISTTRVLGFNVSGWIDYYMYPPSGYTFSNIQFSAVNGTITTSVVSGIFVQVRLNTTGNASNPSQTINFDFDLV